MRPARIREVRACVIEPGEAGADYHNQEQGHWIVDSPIANPMSVYEKYRASRTSWGINALGTVLVQVELQDGTVGIRSEEHTSELQSQSNLVCRLLLEKKNKHRLVPASWPLITHRSIR